MRAHSVRREKLQYNIKSVSYALDVLELFSTNKDELNVSSIVKQLKLSKHCAIKIIASLKNRNYIEVDEDGVNCQLGVMSLLLSKSRIKHVNIKNQANSVLKSLLSDCNETCCVGILKGSNVVYIDTVESTLPVRTVPKFGSTMPAYCTAAGKVLLAGEADLEKRISVPRVNLLKHTPNTITNTKYFINHLKEIAAQGFALEDEEFDLGVRGVAAPIRDHTKEVVGAISISGPVIRLDKARMLNELVPAVKRAAEEISLRVGYVPSMSLE
jgi:DNA-binding IclR family transcriptional regulator